MLQQILEILMAERGKEERAEQLAKLDSIIQKHEDLIPTVSKTQVKVDLYWKCYAYGDELAPYIEFLDGIMLSSTRDIAPSCIENVEELIERQEKSLTQMETKRSVVKDLISKGKVLLENPDKPKFLDSHVGRIEQGWDETKEKATARLTLLNNTKAAWEGYGVGLESVAVEFEKCEGEITKVKKRFNLIAAQEDLAKRQEIFGATKNTIDGIYGKIQSDYACMTMTLPEDKKDFVKKEVNAVTDEFVTELKNFDVTLKEIDAWMTGADKELDTIKTASDKMTPEDRVSYTMELTEDVAAKVDVIKKSVDAEANLLPQGDQVPQDAQDYKAELKRIQDYVIDLHKRVMATCDAFSEDVKFWAEYKTGIRGFKPWLTAAEKTSTEGLSKPQTLDEANAMFAVVKAFEAGCLKHLKILDDAAQASLKMTTHKEADDEVAALRERYAKVKIISDEWMAKCDTLVKEWQLLDNTVTELNSWVASDRGGAEGEQNFSLEKMESTLGELKNIFKEKEKLVENL